VPVRRRSHLSSNRLPVPTSLHSEADVPRETCPATSITLAHTADCAIGQWLPAVCAPATCVKTDHKRQYVLRITEHRTDHPVRESPASNGDVSTAADSTQVSCKKAWWRVTLLLAVDRCRRNCSHLEGWKGGLADASVRRNAFIRFVDSSYRESGSCAAHGSARADGYPQLQPTGTQRQSPRILLLRLATRTA
jgi:hypothetical protein